MNPISISRSCSARRTYLKRPSRLTSTTPLKFKAVSRMVDAYISPATGRTFQLICSLTRVIDWNPVQFLDADANPLRASNNWMNPGVDFPVGSAVLSASNRVQFATENSFAQIEGVDPIPPFTSEEIIFTGNG
jgi:hypothetical protein